MCHHAMPLGSTAHPSLRQNTSKDVLGASQHVWGILGDFSQGYRAQKPLEKAKRMPCFSRKAPRSVQCCRIVRGDGVGECGRWEVSLMVLREELDGSLGGRRRHRRRTVSELEQRAQLMASAGSQTVRRAAVASSAEDTQDPCLDVVASLSCSPLLFKDFTCVSVLPAWV